MCPDLSIIQVFYSVFLSFCIWVIKILFLVGKSLNGLASKKQSQRSEISSIQRIRSPLNFQQQKSFFNRRYLAQIFQFFRAISSNLASTTVYIAISLLQGLLLDCPVAGVCRANLADLNLRNQYLPLAQTNTFQLNLSKGTRCSTAVTNVTAVMTSLTQYSIDTSSTGTNTLNFQTASSTNLHNVTEIGSLINGYCVMFTSGSNKLTFY